MEVSTVFCYNEAMEFKKQAHAAYYTRYHIVISTKYRRKILRDGFGEYVKRAVIGISKQYPEIEVIEVNTDVDHIHIFGFYTAQIFG